MHYLCYGRAMDMHITGVSYCTLVAISWWRLLGFIVYIQQQISSFRAGGLVRMSHQPWFQHIWASSCLSSPIGTWSAHLPIPYLYIWLIKTLFLTAHQNSIWPPERLTVTFSDRKSFQITQPGYIRNLSGKPIWQTQVTLPRKIPSKYPRNTPFQKRTHRTPIQKCNWPPILPPPQSTILPLILFFHWYWIILNLSWYCYIVFVRNVFLSVKKLAQVIGKHAKI